jgi:hypothetical protein
MLRAVRDDLFDIDQHDPFVRRKERGHRAGFVHGGPAIDAQAAAVVEIDEQAADLRVEQDVAEAHEGAVAVEIGKGETASVENADQARAAALERAIAAAIRRAGGEKEEGRSFEAAMKSLAGCDPTAGAPGVPNPINRRFPSVAAPLVRRGESSLVPLSFSLRGISPVGRQAFRDA